MQGQQLTPPKPLPNGEWVETWGAVAEGRENGDTGVSVGKLSRSEAEREAVARCQDWGGSCKPVLAYQNQCVAIVDGPESGHGGGAIARAGSKEKASDIALRLCKNKNNGVECNVSYTACSLPIFRKY
ncbi:DUF4189 domain-containing protein [Xanthomonas fragariae]|uniref:DUF4189 domain-containing protein n=1 Tax=Xanthomonas fragariae TaxID=48664 RepID=UPI003D18D879